MILDGLLESAAAGGGRPAVADPFRSLSYANLVRLAAVMKRQIEQATQAKHVGIMMPSTCAFAGTFYGALWANRVAVPLNFLLQPAELAGVVADSEIDTLFTIKHFAEQVEGLDVKVIFMEDLPLKRELILQRFRRRPRPPTVSADDLAVLLYTSGTSGLPKGVCQTFGNLRHDIEASIDKARLRPDHRFLGVLPQFHSFGLTALLLVPVTLGASVYFIPRFHPATVIETIREQRINVTLMIASMYTALLKSKKRPGEDLSMIEHAVSGGEALLDAVRDQFAERFGVNLLQGYGMTEAAPVVSLNMPWANRLGTVGQPLKGIEVRAFDDDAKPLSPDEIGELWLRGPTVMQGYFKQPDATREVITEDGWYKTGDMGSVDAEGYITVTGRKKEMIIVGGENVYPREIESVLSRHPAVTECAVIGQADASRGEVVVAFVTTQDGSDVSEIALRDFCRDHIAGFKVPRRVIISDDLPRGPTGKVLKRLLVERL